LAAFETIVIHASLSGRPATGAIVGLALLGGLVFLLTQQGLSASARQQKLSRAALFVSVVALVGAFLIPARFAEAQGVAPAAGPVVKTVLFLLFQLGWALTHWLFRVKGEAGQARYIPAAIGAVVLIGGGFMTGGGESRDLGAAEPAGVVYKIFAGQEDLGSAQETVRVGKESGSVFAHLHTGGEPLIGLSMGTRDWFGRERIDGEIQGIFEGESTAALAQVIEAKPGYVVASIEVQADDYVNALRIQFAPYDGVFVSPFDRYWSPWVGSHAKNEPTTRLEGDGVVVGLRGSTGLVLNSLSLLTAG
jgi:hypothetical protein